MSISVKLNEKSLKDVEDLIKKAFDKVISNKKLLNEIGDDVVKDIQFKTRAGKSIPNNEEPFKPLSTARHPFLYAIYGRLDFQKAKTKKAQNKLINLRGQQAAEGYNYIDIRRYISKATPTHQAFREARSNLTLSGQLLNSLKAKFPKKGSILIEPTGIRSKYKIKTAKGVKSIGKLTTNKQISEYVSKKRPYLGVRPIMKERIRRTVIGYIRRSSSVLKFI